MRLVRSCDLFVVALAFAGLGCDRIQELKDRFSSSSKSGGGAGGEVEEIRSLYDASRYDEALQRIQAVVQENPDSADAFYYQGLCYLAKAGQLDAKAPWSEEEAASLSSFERALSINPRHALSAVGIGDLYARRVAPRRRRGGSEDPADPYSLALASYQKAITVDPRLPQAQLRYAIFLERTGQLDLAEGAYRAAVEAAATVPEIAPDYYLAYGRFLAGPANRLDEAIDQFELAKMFRSDDLAIQQEIAIVHSRVGLGHLEKQEYLLAEESLKMAEAMFPDKSIPEARRTVEALEELRTIRRR
jgi:tetratricopeptide (TPR) repeat protein